MFKVNNEDTRTTPIVNLEHIIACWDNGNQLLMNWTFQSSWTEVKNDVKLLSFLEMLYA